MAERLSGMEIRTPIRFNPRRTSEHHPNSHRLSTGPATPNLRGRPPRSLASFTLRVHPRVLTILQQATRDKKHTVHNSGCERETLVALAEVSTIFFIRPCTAGVVVAITTTALYSFSFIRFSAPPFRRATALRAPALPFTAPPGVMPLSRWKAKHGFGRSHAAVFSRRAWRLDKKTRATSHNTMQHTYATSLVWFILLSTHALSLPFRPPRVVYDPPPSEPG
jgi:hypothetical protein